MSTLHVALLFVKAGNEMAQVEVLDHSLEDGVAADFNVLDLDLGAFGDEVHLALAFLL